MQRERAGILLHHSRNLSLCQVKRVELRSVAINEAPLVDMALEVVYGWSGYGKIGGDGYCTTQQEDLIIENVSGSLAYEYGEITTRGMRTLATAVELAENDSFFDLGSGVRISTADFISARP